MAHTQGEPHPVRTRDGRELFTMQLRGPAGAPTVVFEAGMATSRSSWALVQPAVAGFARAVVYDRSGLGRSAPDPRARTLSRITADLQDLLDDLGPGPFVLVGHSAGGLYVRAAAAERPERIAGLVLVDPFDEAADVIYTPSFRRLERVGQRVTSVLARLGLLRFAFRSMLAPMPPDVAAELRREGFTTGVARTRGAELAGLVAASNALRGGGLDLGELPVTVISGALTGSGMSSEIRAAATASHRARAARSPHGRHVLAERSGQFVPITEPGIVVAEIRRLVAATARR